MFVSSQVKKPGGLKFKPGVKPKAPGASSSAPSQPPTQSQPSQSQSVSRSQPEQTQPVEQQTQQSQQSIREAAIGLSVQIENSNKRVHFPSTEVTEPDQQQQQQQPLKPIIKPTIQPVPETSRDIDPPSSAPQSPLIPSRPLMPPKIFSAKTGNVISKPFGTGITPPAQPHQTQNNSTPSSSTPRPVSPTRRPSSPTRRISPTRRPSIAINNTPDEPRAPSPPPRVETEDDLRHLTITQLIRLQSNVLKPSRRGALENLQKEAARNLRKQRGRKGKKKKGSGGDEEEVEGAEGSDDDDARSVASNASSIRSTSSSQRGRPKLHPSNTNSTPGSPNIPTRTSGALNPTQPTQSTQSAAPTSSQGPRIQIIDGKIVIDDSSLFIDAPNTQALEEAHRDDMEVVDESAGTQHITSASFRVNKIRRTVWSPEANERFYKYLQYFGADFEIISHLFPDLQRRHIKLKFNAEERLNPAKITHALKNRLTIPAEVIQEMKDNHAEKMNIRVNRGRPTKEDSSTDQPEEALSSKEDGDESSEKRDPSDPRNGSSSGSASQNPETATPIPREDTPEPAITATTAVLQALFQRSVATSKMNIKPKPTTKPTKPPAINTSTAPTNNNGELSPTKKNSPTKRKRSSSQSPTRSVSPTRPPPVISASGGGGAGSLKFKPSFKPKPTVKPKPLSTPTAAPPTADVSPPLIVPEAAPEVQEVSEPAPSVTTTTSSIRQIPKIGKGKPTSGPSSSVGKPIGKPIQSSFSTSNKTVAAATGIEDAAGEEDGDLVNDTEMYGGDEDDGEGMEY